MLSVSRNPFVIISANTKKQSAVEAFKQSYALKNYLIDCKISFKIVSGQYGGKTEVSFLIPNISEKDALGIAKMFNQRCILIVNKHREAHLLFIDGKISQMGYFMTGESDDNFTIDNGIKYVCTGA